MFSQRLDGICTLIARAEFGSTTLKYFSPLREGRKNEGVGRGTYRDGG
jgi:hypothetical protein